jgi:hypothetical protein
MLRPRLAPSLLAPVLAAFLLAVLLFPPAALAAEANEEEETSDMPSDMPGYSTDALRKLALLVQRTGVGADAIPSLYRPGFLSISDADLSMENDEVVFVVHYPNNLVRIYPQRIMVWHEVVNDVLPDAEGRLPPALPGMPGPAGENYTLSYSPLTGSVVAFRSMAGAYPSSFGISGNLLNGNSVLYDRISRSLWSQLLATGIEGPFRGKRLDRIPVFSARWRGVKERYGGLHSAFTGKAEVLSRSTGFRRSYGKDPYGSYQVPGTYYDDNRLPFPVDKLDPRLPPKKRILGIEVDSAFGAVQKDFVREKRVFNFSLGVTPLVALYDGELDAVRIFSRRLPGRDGDLSFIIFEDKLVDEQTRSEWLPTGVSTFGPLREQALNGVLAIDSMWFAWASFYQGTHIFPGKEF